MKGIRGEKYLTSTHQPTHPHNKTFLGFKKGGYFRVKWKVESSFLEQIIFMDHLGVCSASSLWGIKLISMWSECVILYKKKPSEKTLDPNILKSKHDGLVFGILLSKLLTKMFFLTKGNWKRWVQIGPPKIVPKINLRSQVRSLVDPIFWSRPLLLLI